MIATIPLATGNKLNCFISVRGILAIVWHCVLLFCCFLVCIFLLIFYMLINHLLKKKKKNCGQNVNLGEIVIGIHIIKILLCIINFRPVHSNFTLGHRLL